MYLDLVNLAKSSAQNS